MSINTTNRQPSHRLHVVKGEGKKTRWTEIGAAWANNDGQGFTLILDAIPTDGRIVMRAVTANDDGGNTGEDGAQQ